MNTNFTLLKAIVGLSLSFVLHFTYAQSKKEIIANQQTQIDRLKTLISNAESNLQRVERANKNISTDIAATETKIKNLREFISNQPNSMYFYEYTIENQSDSIRKLLLILPEEYASDFKTENSAYVDDIEDDFDIDDETENRKIYDFSKYKLNREYEIIGFFDSYNDFSYNSYTPVCFLNQNNEAMYFGIDEIIGTEKKDYILVDGVEASYCWGQMTRWYIYETSNKENIGKKFLIKFILVEVEDIEWSEDGSIQNSKTVKVPQITDLILLE